MISTIALDSSVLVAILKKEGEGERLADVISENRIIIGWPTVLETRIWCIRNGTLTQNSLFNEIMSMTNLAPIAFDQSLEQLASSAYTQFGKGRHPAKLNYGDCMAYAVAKHHDVPLLFKGADFGLTDVKLHSASVITA